MEIRANNSREQEEAVHKMVEASGFQLTDTGGGIEQYLLTMPNGSYAIITNAEGDVPTTPSQPCVIGFYSSEGESLRFENAPNLAEAIKASA